MTEDKVYCLLCPDIVQGFEEAVEHVRIVHPEYYSEPERWPDGSLVINDHTLEPEDFTKSPETG